MIYEAPWSLSAASVAHLAIQGLEDLVSGTARAGRLRTCDEAGALICSAQHRPRRQITLDTNGGGLSYMHSDMYGRNALQESVRQMRGTAPAQVPGAKISVCHGVGGMLAASGTIIMTNQGP
jgi:hypothetical protein